MLGYIGRRLLHLFPVLLAVTLLTFLIASLLPGDLAYAILGDQATPDKVAARLRVLPATGWVPFEEDAAGNLRSFVLPALTLALGEWPVLMRVLRSDMIATLQEDYIAMAKAKGLRPARILLVHALKPSSLTLVTVTGINIGRLIGGAVIVESIFALPGIGRLLVGAIYARDFIILQGVVLFVAVGFVVLNFAVDMLYAALDPRIRHGRA